MKNDFYKRFKLENMSSSALKLPFLIKSPTHFPRLPLNSSFGNILPSAKLHLVVIYANFTCFNFSPSASCRFRLFKTLYGIY